LHRNESLRFYKDCSLGYRLLSKGAHYNAIKYFGVSIFVCVIMRVLVLQLYGTYYYVSLDGILGMDLFFEKQHYGDIGMGHLPLKQDVQA
jgi:hypothetical protein